MINQPINNAENGIMRYMVNLDWDATMQNHL